MAITNGQNFEQIITEAQVLVDFYADWCGPCKSMAPTLDAFADTHTDINVVKVNVDQRPDLASKYGVRSIPTLVAFKAGVETQRTIGAANINQLEELFV